MVLVWGLRPTRVSRLRYKAGNSFYFSNCPVLSRLSQMQALIFTHLRFPPRGGYWVLSLASTLLLCIQRYDYLAGRLQKWSHAPQSRMRTQRIESRRGQV